MQADYHSISQKRLDIQRNRIDACDTLLDYIHDDVPHERQEPFKTVIERLQQNLKDEMSEAFDQ